MGRKHKKAEQSVEIVESAKTSILILSGSANSR